MITLDTYERILRVYSQLLATARQANASARCNINIGTISGILNSNCNIVIRNICTAQANTVSLLDAAVGIINSIQNNQDTAVADLYNSSRQTCLSQASILLNLTVQDISLGECRSSIPIQMSFINSGDAVANCIVGQLASSVINDTIQPETNTHYDTYFPMIALGVIGAGIVTLALLVFQRQSKRVIWRRT